jgi:hypothetical protein
MNSMVNGERLDVRIVTSTGADSYALGYSEAEFRRLKFQGEYLRELRPILYCASEGRLLDLPEGRHNGFSSSGFSRRTD